MGEVWRTWLCHGGSTDILGCLGWLGRGLSSSRGAEEAAPAHEQDLSLPLPF